MKTQQPDQIGLHQAKTHFSELVRRVEAGEEITILRRGKPVARLVPSEIDETSRPLGLLQGKWTLPPDEVLIGPDPELEALFYDDDG